MTLEIYHDGLHNPADLPAPTGTAMALPLARDVDEGAADEGANEGANEGGVNEGANEGGVNQGAADGGVADGGANEGDADSAGIELHPDEIAFTVTVVLPSGEKLKEELTVLPAEQIQEVCQSITERREAFGFTCFHLEFQGERLNDFIHVSDVSGLRQGSSLRLVEDPYTEKDARMHLLRIRDLIGAAGDRPDAVQGILTAPSLFCDVELRAQTAKWPTQSSADFDAPISLTTLVPQEPEPTPKTIKLLSLSPWNPPPAHLRQKGHLLYVSLITNEGDQYQITSHISGFYVNKSTNTKFDPLPRTAPKAFHEHSLLDLIETLSPSFGAHFYELQELGRKKESLTTYILGNFFPPAPWVVPSPASSLLAHSADITRSQEVLLFGGTENTDNLRDWNEEFQYAKDLPKDNIQDRIFRERLLSKLFADYNDAAARGAMLVARGEITPLNPTDTKDAQLFIYNNIFFSVGADGAGTFTAEGGDEAARVATGKDVEGVKLINDLEIDGIHTPSTAVVDYLGKRIVAQSIVPGIFKQPEPGENQIHYGAVDGKDVIANDVRFAEPFAKIAEAFKIKRHPVWDKEKKRFDLEASVEMKGLVGTDGRRYVLDLYRITPMDIAWAEDASHEGPEYPHRFTLLRMELVDSFYKHKYREWINRGGALKMEVMKPPASPDTSKPNEAASEEAREEATADGPGLAKPDEAASEKAHEEGSEDAVLKEPRDGASQDGDAEASKGEETPKGKDAPKSEEALLIKETSQVTPTGDPSGGEAEKNEPGQQPSDVPQSELENMEIIQTTIDTSGFKCALNPDVFCGQQPQTDVEKAEVEEDEKLIRETCAYLLETVIPEFVLELKASLSQYPLDGQSLTRTLHQRGINMRYLGKVVAECEKEKVDGLRDLCVREMIVRSFKHIAARYLRSLPYCFAPVCLAHLLNCLLGHALNHQPTAEVDQSMRALYGDADFSFESATLEKMREEIQEETSRRFRYSLVDGWWELARRISLLREISLRMGLQLRAKDYVFVPPEKDKQKPSPADSKAAEKPKTKPENDGHGGEGKKKKRKSWDGSPGSAASSTVPHTFSPDDIINIVPLIKISTPQSSLAEDVLEQAHMALLGGQKKLGEDLVLEAVSLHEQIYGLIHPEVARVYHRVSQLYSSIGHKTLAFDFARRAVIVSERSTGVDSSETIINYLHLSLLMYNTGACHPALIYAKHGLSLWQIVFGLEHPDTVTTMNNVAVMCQYVHAYNESRRWFEESLRICDAVMGRQTVNSATLLFQLAQALALDSEPQQAVTRMKESYNIFLALLGPEDKNTKEASTWLEQLTGSAVAILRKKKDMATAPPAASLTRQTLLRAPVAATANQSREAGLIDTSSSSTTRLQTKRTGADPRNVDDLIKFINGGQGKKPSESNTQGGKSNPNKRRGGAKTGGNSGA